ncbi:MAG TPA: vanadium-dependent haloperoxidase [Streptosporangiaceae bacterium]|nr:vanadium-dependent haloperoxidase [Streptosporangiaceae bacterium]
MTSRRYAKDFREVKRLGGDGVNTPSARTADQTQVALFWVESSPLRWNRIARTVATKKGLDLWENARLFGLLNMALSDGYVATFDTKYKAYNYWRPVTAIQNAATDGNPRTKADPTWTPLVTTPPIPDYDSGHSVEGGAAAQVLKQFFGTDHVRFKTCSYTLPPGQTCTDASPVLRRYTTFTQAAHENGLSRILVGFHFRKAVKAGIVHGIKIGAWAVDGFLQPVTKRRGAVTPPVRQNHEPTAGRARRPAAGATSWVAQHMRSPYQDHSAGSPPAGSGLPPRRSRRRSRRS